VQKGAVERSSGGDRVPLRTTARVPQGNITRFFSGARTAATWKVRTAIVELSKGKVDSLAGENCTQRLLSEIETPRLSVTIDAAGKPGALLAEDQERRASSVI
jgi:hypothetical protein